MASASSPLGYDLIVIPSSPKQGFFLFPHTIARFRNDRASNWAYLGFFWRRFHTEFGQTDGFTPISQNNSPAFSRIRPKKSNLILQNRRTHRGATVGET